MEKQVLRAYITVAYLHILSKSVIQISSQVDVFMYIYKTKVTQE
jgi:hypothetical protein